MSGDVRRELARFGPPGGMPEVLEAWPEAVGEMIAANAWPARISRDGTLHVSTSSSAWAFELAQLGETVAARLREQLGESAPKAVRFAVGHVPEALAPTEPALRSEAPEPTRQALAEAARLAAGIADPELRRTVERAAALGLSRPPSDLRF